MPNAFSKEERVAFEDLLEGFQDDARLDTEFRKSIKTVIRIFKNDLIE